MVREKKKLMNVKPSRSNISLITLAATLIMFNVDCVSGETKKPAKLVAYDSITVPGEKVILTAKLEKKVLFFRPDLKGERLVFHIDNKKVGECITNEEGYAFVPYTINRPGEFELDVQLSTASRYVTHKRSAKIYCCNKKKPAIIVDIDHTVADVGWLGAMIRPNKEIMPLKNAPDILQKISQKYDIVFVTKREENFLRKTETWLKMYKFPDAPVFFWDLGDYPISSVKYKTERIRKLRQIWKNISIGIGDRDSDIEAYLANGMKVIKIGKENKIIPGVTFVSDWNDIEKLLMVK